MLKSIRFIFLSITILSTHAMATTGNGFKSAVDEFTYAMEVEGAQKDALATKAATQRLKADLLSLGLSNAELIEGALSQTQNKKLAQELRQAFAQIDAQKMGREQAIEHMKSILAQSEVKGASWNGSGRADLIIMGAFILLFVVIIATAGPARCGKKMVPEDAEYCANLPEHEPHDWNTDWD